MHEIKICNLKPSIRRSVNDVSRRLCGCGGLYNFDNPRASWLKLSDSVFIGLKEEGGGQSQKTRFSLLT